VALAAETATSSTMSQSRFLMIFQYSSSSM
jgi:hypothetical protein